VRANLQKPNKCGVRLHFPKTTCCRFLFVPAIVLAIVPSVCPQGANKTADVKSIQHFVELGQTDTAEKRLWEVLLRTPDNAPALNLLGLIRTKQKRFPEAEALLKRALEAAPDSIAAYSNLAELYALQGRSEEAKTAFLRAYQLNTHNVKASLALAKIYEEDSEFQRSVEIITSIPAKLRSSATLPILASDYFGLKQPEKVADLMSEVHRSSSTDPTLISRFAGVLAENGFADDAAELLKTATPAQKSTADYLLVLARVQEQQGDMSTAQHTLARVTSHYPRVSDGWLQAARIASKANDYRKEAALLEKLLEIEPNNVEALKHVVVARMRAGEPRQAITAAHHLYSIKPENPDAAYLFATALVNHAEWLEARPVVEKLLSLRDDVKSRMMSGLVLMNDGDIDGASVQIERALQQNPNETEAHYYKGVIARQRGDVQGAIKEMEVVLNANSQHVMAQAELGTLSLQVGNLDGARKALEAAVALAPSVPENHYQLALTYSRLGLSEKAKVEMEEFRKLRAAADKAMVAGTKSVDH